MEQIGNYTLIREIGGGNYGKVYLAKNASSNLFALKKIQTRSVNKKLLSLIENEVTTLSVIHNQGILKLIESIQQDRNICIVTEYCSGGDLEKLLNRCQKIPVHIAKRWLKRIIQALSDLRKQNIVHRDIKIANLMLTDPDPEKADIKIGDFGFSKFLGESLTSTQLGTPLYMAPEIFNSNHYNYKIDVWSLGVVAYEMLFGKPPFQCYKLEELRQLQRKPIFFPEGLNICEEAKDVIRAMLTYDPEQRFGYEELLQMPFFYEKVEVPVQVILPEENKLDDEYEMIEQVSEGEYEDLEDDKKNSSDFALEDKKEKIVNLINEKVEEQKIPQPVVIQEKIKVPDNVIQEKNKVPYNVIQEKIKVPIVSDNVIQEKPKAPLVPDTQLISLPSQQVKIIEEIPKNSARLSKTGALVKEKIEKCKQNDRSQQEIQSLLLQHEHKVKLIEDSRALETIFSKVNEVLYGLSKYVHGNFNTMCQQVEELNSRYPQNEHLENVFSEKFDYYQFQIIEASEKIENLTKILKDQANDMKVQENIIDQAYVYLQNSDDPEMKKIAYTLLNVGYYLYPENEIILEALSAI
ncbi:hypothetical protein SteCoe_28988 [Stentor coeruleus]|uniref:Protein kinase domain-containing protein n=1 Tax=Stentor coeruleus TaxID=5963 RepID=A0A1R2B6W1_9CILI|nr:hypothetical protein SteCoe_28988 [Stentor coeruleus]